jgi:hypothetical protein
MMSCALWVATCSLKALWIKNDRFLRQRYRILKENPRVQEKLSSGGTKTETAAPPTRSRVVNKLASIMELPGGQIAPETLLNAATTRFEAFSGNLQATADQMAQLKAQHDAAQRRIALLTSERDAVGSARRSSSRTSERGHPPRSSGRT